MGIIGLAVGPDPINCAVDNLAAVNYANNLIRWRLQQGCDVAPQKPLALLPNGDLLAILDSIICQRDPPSIRVSKVRGHADLNATPEERAHVDFA